MNKWNEIVKITADFTGVDKSKLLRKTKIEADLGVTGDDASEFIEQFVTYFNVGYEGFNIGEYFGFEGFDPLGMSTIYNKVFRKNTSKRSKHELTLGELEEWAIRGCWNDKNSGNEAKN